MIIANASNAENKYRTQSPNTPNYFTAVFLINTCKHCRLIKLKNKFFSSHCIYRYLTFCFIFIEIKLRQLQGLGGISPTSETCRTNIDQREAGPTRTELHQLNNNSNTKPNMEETVNTITNRLKERRRELGLPDSIKVRIVHLASLTKFS